MATFFENLKSYKDAIATASTLTAANVELSANLAEMVTENEKLNGQVATLTDERDATKAELAKAQAAVKDFDAKVEKAATAKSIATVAALGHTPVAGTTADGTQQSKTELKGRARFIAASQNDLGKHYGAPSRN